ncbi:MAG: 3-isopropylmalate dehydrogenase, partial [Methylococcus sp.]
MTHKIAVLPGDGIGTEIVAEALKVLDALRQDHGLQVETEAALIGGVAYDATGTPFPEATLKLCQQADSVLLGAVGGPKWEPLDYSVRPERGLLGLRSELELFANLRPAILYPQLVAASTLKPEVVSGLDIMIIRELTGGIYFGQPRGRRTNDRGEREGFNTLIYNESEIRRIGHIAFQTARKRNRKLCSVDKANVLECTELWREVMLEVGKEYPDVELSHMYVDNAAMQLVRALFYIDAMATENMFGDILSDCAAMLTGSIGMLPSASLDKNG